MTKLMGRVDSAATRGARKQSVQARVSTLLKPSESNMTDIVEQLRKVGRLQGDTYSSYEILGMVREAADTIERLRAMLKPFADWAQDCEEDQDDQFINHSDAYSATVGDLRNARRALERKP